MYGRFSSSCALLTSVAVIGISAACGMCILCTQNLTHLATAFAFIFYHNTQCQNTTGHCVSTVQCNRHFKAGTSELCVIEQAAPRTVMLRWEYSYLYAR